MLPWLFLVILAQIAFFLWALWAGRTEGLPALRVVVAGDLSVTVLVAFLLWRALGRRR
ncbi:MAG: hypothetical protein ACO3ND_05365 [Opitutales bacterium]